MPELSKFNKARLICMLFVVASCAASGQTFATFASFDNTNGAHPFYVSLTQGVDGSFYGAATAGGRNCTSYGCGTVFKLTRAGALTALYSFCKDFNCADGSIPFSGVTLGIDKNFYGTTAAGGNGENCKQAGCGTVFKITPSGSLTQLHSFQRSDGWEPWGTIAQGIDKNWYGTTYKGGLHKIGEVFRANPEGEITVLTSFCFDVHCPQLPFRTLNLGSDGYFYGVTQGGGINEGGTVYKINSHGRGVVLHSFTPFDSNGTEPVGVVEGSDGNFYGTTAEGGNLDCDAPYGCGTIFKLTPDGTVTVLYSFNLTDGWTPLAGLVQATDGNFYGTTSRGGDMTCVDAEEGCGTLFQITSDGAFTVLHVFEGTDGFDSEGTLFQATDGRLYGTTAYGGSLGYGTVFSLDMALPPFVSFIFDYAKAGQSGGILGQGLLGTISVSFNGVPASFTVKSDTYLVATVQIGRAHV